MQIKCKYFKDINNINEIINFISYIVIYWYSFLTVISISKTIKSSMETNISYDMLVSNLSIIFNIHSTILIIPLLLGFIMLFKKVFKLYYLALVILISYFFHVYELIDNYLHPLIFKTGVYDFLLREGQQVLNPQYTKLFLFVFLIAALLIISYIKKYRSVDRIFITLIISIVLGTTILFHFAIPMGMFKIAKKEFEKNAVYQILNVNPQDLCEDKNCYYFDNDLKLIDKSYNANLKLISTYQYYFNGVKYNNELLNNIYVDSLGSFEGLRFDYIIAVTKKTDTGYFTVMDENQMKYLSRSSELWFSFLASCAHFIWVFGGIFLLMIHKNKLIRKVNITS